MGDDAVAPCVKSIACRLFRIRPSRKIESRAGEELYQRTEYEDRILLPDRVLAMCRDLFNYLIETRVRYQSTTSHHSRAFWNIRSHGDALRVCFQDSGIQGHCHFRKARSG
jgi:hypothetical protein